MTMIAATTGERMSAAERLAFLRETVESHHLQHPDVARYTGYTVNSVSGWFTDQKSPRYREIPARAVDRLLLELKSGNVKSSK